MTFFLSYIQYVEEIQNVSWDRLKFLDECHVVPRKINKTKVLGPVGERTCITVADLHEKSFSVTLMTRLNEDKPFVFDIREESNDQWDFAKFVTDCVADGDLAAGDFLIVDNASVHGGLDSIDLLLDFLEEHNITLVYLPAYSPELNPCENVFCALKTHLRQHRNHELPVWADVVEGLAKITYLQLYKFYDHCIYFEKVAKKVHDMK